MLCAKKRRFPRWQDAWAAADRLNDPDVRPYDCPECGHIHIGHDRVRMEYNKRQGGLIRVYPRGRSSIAPSPRERSGAT